MNEMWKSIPSLTLYEASSLGRIRNAKNWRVKATKITRFGRVQTALYINGKLKSFLVHRIILEAFIGPCPPGHECNHLDGNPQNNCLENLEWTTRHENLKHAYRNGLNSQSGSQNGNAKLKEAAVIQIKERLKMGESQKDIADDLGIPSVTVNHIARGRTWPNVRPGKEDRPAEPSRFIGESF